ncbi:MarR family winged helix-turn-helix transcriptional regulator [Desulfohalobium retbaense]|uniref:Transcriptional regulator, MarR family n=1 Tax=Desulfohalobium retbaense (strain ATCC 49708 / DSM 5692 / JCM 16813 / HR100) TaxID=485915 RepID=C8X205_DESRD|nr:MarR family transcriptional regulator [Desulfohalobium retbaense]ACV68328.1 transcriptional regulator, MarR family [Desulfohalobium retbaense DSM 5692]
MYNEEIKEIVKQIRQLVRAVYRDSLTMAREYGLTPPQCALLRTIYLQGPLSSAALSRNLFVTPSNITGIVDRLVKKDMVVRERQLKDRRVTLISLTATGHTLAASLPDNIETKLVEGLSELQDSHIQDLSRSLAEILALIDASHVTAAPLELPRRH